MNRSIESILHSFCAHRWIELHFTLLKSTQLNILQLSSLNTVSVLPVSCMTRWPIESYTRLWLGLKQHRLVDWSTDLVRIYQPSIQVLCPGYKYVRERRDLGGGIRSVFVPVPSILLLLLNSLFHFFSHSLFLLFPFPSFTISPFPLFSFPRYSYRIFLNAWSEQYKSFLLSLFPSLWCCSAWHPLSSIFGLFLDNISKFQEIWRGLKVSINHQYMCFSQVGAKERERERAREREKEGERKKRKRRREEI